MSDVTRILDRVQQGGLKAAEALLPLVYEDLRKLAIVRMANEKPGHALRPGCGWFFAQLPEVPELEIAWLAGGSKAVAAGAEGERGQQTVGGQRGEFLAGLDHRQPDFAVGDAEGGDAAIGTERHVTATGRNERLWNAVPRTPIFRPPECR